MFENKPIKLNECKDFFDNLQYIKDLEKLITVVNHEILNVLTKNNIIKSKNPILIMKFSIHFGITKILNVDNLADLQVLIDSLKETFIKEGFRVSLHNQSNGTIIFSLSLPFNIEPTFV